MSDAACKIVIDRGVQHMAGATADLLLLDSSAFPPEAIELMGDLDAAYLTATRLIHQGDAKTAELVTQFGADVAARAAVRAAVRAGLEQEFSEE